MNNIIKLSIFFLPIFLLTQLESPSSTQTSRNREHEKSVISNRNSKEKDIEKQYTEEDEDIKERHTQSFGINPNSQLIKTASCIPPIILATIIIVVLVILRSNISSQQKSIESTTDSIKSLQGMVTTLIKKISCLEDPTSPDCG